MNGTRVSSAPPQERTEEVERGCKFCGGFLTLFKCQNWSLDLYGKEARVRATKTGLPGFQFTVAEETGCLDGREVSRVELDKFFDLCVKQKRPCKLYGKEFRGDSKKWVCEECDELLVRKSITNPCPDCCKNEPDTILKRFDRADKDALKVELGETDSSLEEFCSVEDASLFLGKEWQGYRIEIFGLKMGRYSEWHLSTEFSEAIKVLPDDLRQQWATMNPFYMMPFPCIVVPEDPDLIIRLYRLRVRHENSPLYVEMRAHLYGVRRVAIQGLEYDYGAPDLERAVKGRELVIKIAPPEPHIGRPRDLEGETLSDIAKVFACFWFCHDYMELPEMPDQKELCKYYGVYRTTLYRHITEKLKGDWSGKKGVKAEGKTIALTLTAEALPDYFKSRYQIKD